MIKVLLVDREDITIRDANKWKVSESGHLHVFTDSTTTTGDVSPTDKTAGPSTGPHLRASSQRQACASFAPNSWEAVVQVASDINLRGVDALAKARTPRGTPSRGVRCQPGACEQCHPTGTDDE